MAEQSGDRPDQIGQVWAIQGYVIHPDQRFSPPIDVIETDDRVVVLVEVAGMRGDDLKIALHNQRLTISGVRQRPQIAADTFYRAEIGFGEFRLTVPLPWSIIDEAITASYQNGFLRVDLPRQGAQRVHIVDVNTNEG